MNKETKEALLAIRRRMQSGEREIDPAQFPLAFTDVAYCSDHEAQKLDIFLPDTTGVHPVIVMIHGGGWAFGGRREECVSHVFGLVSQGYAVAAIDYRLVPDVTFPSQIHDVKAAIRYLRAHAEEYHINTDTLVLWGNSAGAHLAALAAVGNDPLLEDLAQGNANYPSDVDGIIAWYGAYDFTTIEDQQRQRDPQWQLSANDPMPAMLRGRAKEASPVFYIRDTFPPILLQHGLADTTVPCQQTEEFAKVLRSRVHGLRMEVEYFPGARHGDPAFKTEENVLRCLRFLDSIYYPDGKVPARGPIPELRFVPSRVKECDPFE